MNIKADYLKYATTDISNKISTSDCYSDISNGTISRLYIDPVLLKQIDDMKLEIERLTNMVNHLYYPFCQK